MRFLNLTTGKVDELEGHEEPRRQPLESLKKFTLQRSIVTDPDEIRLLLEGPSYPPKRAFSPDSFLEDILTNTHRYRPNSTERIGPITKSTYDHGYRRVFSGWPRDPDGQVYSLPWSEGKRPPTATHTWGATLYDFYRVNTLASYPGVVTWTCGNRLATFCRANGELDYAKDELEWADNERDPWKREAADIALIHHIECDYLVQSTYMNMFINRHFCPTEFSRIPFHPSSYPYPWPVQPFSSPTPRLETTIPLHLLPEKLVVHDPYNLLSGRTRQWTQYKDDENLDEISHWPFAFAPSGPKDYQPQIYKLKLTSSTVDKIKKTRKAIQGSNPTVPAAILTNIFPSKEPGETREPVFQIHVPAPPPPPTHTPEAHLYLTQHPHRRKGTGHHSIVYEAEWEAPREWFVSPRICMGCIMEKALEFRDQWAAEEGNGKDSGMSDTKKMAGFKFAPDRDWMMPISRDAKITQSSEETKVWEDTPRFDSSAHSILDERYPVVGNVHVETETQVRQKIVIRAIDEEVKQRENEKLALEKRGDKPDPWEGARHCPHCFEHQVPLLETCPCQKGKKAEANKEEAKNDGLNKTDAKGKGKAREAPVEEAEGPKKDTRREGKDRSATVEDAPDRESEEEIPSRKSFGLDDGEQSGPKPEITTTTTIQYEGSMRLVYISSVPWLHPGVPTCHKHGLRYSYSIAKPKDVDESGSPTGDSKQSPKPSPLLPIPLVPSPFHPDCRLPPTMRAVVTAKISRPGDDHLSEEGVNYQKFPQSFSEHWGGYTIVHPIPDPVPCGALVPAFYGYYVRDEKANAQDGDGEEAKEYFSPLLLLEDCGVPINPNEMSQDDRQECIGLLSRFHYHGWVHGSFSPRNILVRKGDHEDYPPYRNEEDRRYRLIDFGRSECRDDDPTHEPGTDTPMSRWDSIRFREKRDGLLTMEIPGAH
ncbi:hypothetical protein V5O48_005392 [Marasmius crinis-equi]|uniref:Protein kinase domain-containing protein n=1 Tax=Marasmius crinis-equi TaxID=585013 RepID=A0ABR3FMG2_9AGAR